MFLFLPTSGEPSVNRIDLPALTPWQKPVLDHLAVHLLENSLYILTKIIHFVMIKRVNILLCRINLEQRFLQKIFEIQLLKYSKRGLIYLKNLI